MQSCAAVTRQLLALPQRPTAILFPDDFSAIGGIQTIREKDFLIRGIFRWSAMTAT